ncbi:MAG: DUF6531 domain-containing protein [Candidatus Eremiobacteraeota bacterium]|nr:DUF6531 domain-containing protein [Candidatus Eremiobacteraeota bacterium]
MNVSFHRCTAVMIAAALLYPQIGMPSAETALGSSFSRQAARSAAAAVPAMSPPQRIAVPEPSPRARTPLPPLASIHAIVSRDIHVPHGVKGQGPPMLRPGQIDAVLTAARQRAVQGHSHRPQAIQPVTRSLTPGGTRAGTAPGNARGRGIRTVQSTGGTGINPWWRYQEENVPGGGHLMVNVGTGNLLVQGDDMSVPHKGIAMAFRRTYNSQSQHDVNGSDGSAPSM